MNHGEYMESDCILRMFLSVLAGTPLTDRVLLRFMK